MILLILPGQQSPEAFLSPEGYLTLPLLSGVWQGLASVVCSLRSVFLDLTSGEREWPEGAVPEAAGTQEASG